MNHLFRLLFLVAFVTFGECANYLSHKNSGRRTKSTEDGKIVGGYNTTIQQVPYQAYLLLKKGSDYYQCGGSIINRRTILTAAHCLTGIQMAYVRVGSTDADSGGTQYTSVDLRQHPRYNATSSDYDVGVIKLMRLITYSDDVKPVRLASNGSPVNAGTNVLVTGWGATSENGAVSQNLMAVSVPVVARSECNTEYNGGITSRMFCAGVPEGGKDSCQGDSGGPAVSEESGVPVQRGIVSFGIGCARKGYPGVYTRVGAVRSWINLNAGA